MRGDDAAELAALERLIAAALRADDPEQALADGAAAAGLSVALGARVAAIQGDGLRLAARLVARLRFERLIQGSAAASAWFDADPRAFVGAFRRYHAEVPARAGFPGEEAALFAAWSSEQPDAPRP